MTIDKAQLLIDEAHAQEILCRCIKEISEIHAKQAIEEAHLACKKLLSAEKHIGKVFYMVKASGFQAQTPKPARTPTIVQVNGGADDSISDEFKI